MSERIKPELREILEKYQIDPSDEDQLWSCRGTLVLYHSAFERIAQIEKVVWSKPEVVVAEVHGEHWNVAVLVTGSVYSEVGELLRSEWSIGEASVLNYFVSGRQQGYPFAMAEKRGKDRVIAKLARLSEYGVYSEEEADEFRRPERSAEPEKLPPPQEERRVPEHLQDKPALDNIPALPIPMCAADWSQWERDIRAAVDDIQNAGDLRVLWKRNEQALQTAEQSYSAFYRGVKAAFQARHLELNPPR